MVEEWGVRRHRQQQGQLLTKAVADGDRTICALDPDVHVEAPGVVSLGHPPEVALEPLVVRGVDDLLVAVVGPRVRAGRTEQDPEPVGETEERRATLLLEVDRLGHGLGPARADLDLGGDQLPGDRIPERRFVLGCSAEFFVAIDQIEGIGVEDRELLLEADGEVGRVLESLSGNSEIERIGFGHFAQER